MYHWLVMSDSKPVALGDSVASPLVVRAGERLRANVRLIVLLATGHLVVDLIQGSLPAILPFLKAAHNLSYTAAGAIVLMANLTSSVIQPVFGYLADRASRRWLLPLAVVLAGVGLALTGLAPNYPVLLVLVVVMGLGVAAYHPEGYRTATSVAGDRKATALSWFSLGGNIGIALGPPAITMLIAAFGLFGSLAMVVPAALAAALLVAALPWLALAERPGVILRTASQRPSMPGAMALLIFIVMVRSWTQLGLTTFVPFYYIDHLGADPRIIGPLLFVFLGAGAAGTVVAGPLADRFGPRRVMLWVFAAAAPLVMLFLEARGALAFVTLGLVGAVLVSTFTVSVVLGQAYLPRSAGMASGLIVGFAIGTGGLGVTLLGWIADHWGLVRALWITAAMPLIGFAATLFLPAPAEST